MIDGQVVDGVGDVVVLEPRGQLVEAQVVGVLGALGAGDLDPQAERVGVGLLAADAQHGGHRGVADGQDQVGRSGGVGVHRHD